MILDRICYNRSDYCSLERMHNNLLEEFAKNCHKITFGCSLMLMELGNWHIAIFEHTNLMFVMIDDARVLSRGIC